MWMFQTGKMANNDFYLRYYVGHKGKFGHEFLEFEFRPDGKLRWEERFGVFMMNNLMFIDCQVRQQQQLQERHHDQEGGLRPRRRDGRTQESHRGQRDHGGGRRPLAST